MFLRGNKISISTRLAASMTRDTRGWTFYPKPIEKTLLWVITYNTIKDSFIFYFNKDNILMFLISKALMERNHDPFTI